jgi:hypothetical protein
LHQNYDDPYHNFVSSFAQLAAAGKHCPWVAFRHTTNPNPLPNVPAAIIFSPHPDDECIAGGQGGKQISATENPGSRLDLIH